MSSDALEYFYGITPERLDAMKNTPPPKSTDEAWKEHYRLQEEYIEELERELNAANSRIELLEACNADVARIAKERNEALKRIRQLEEAGDSMVRWVEDYGCKHEFYPAISIWTAAKEAKP